MPALPLLCPQVIIDAATYESSGTVRIKHLQGRQEEEAAADEAPRYLVGLLARTAAQAGGGAARPPPEAEEEEEALARLRHRNNRWK